MVSTDTVQWSSTVVQYGTGTLQLWKRNVLYVGCGKGGKLCNAMVGHLGYLKLYLVTVYSPRCYTRVELEMDK